jgi:hypothetical protein
MKISDKTQYILITILFVLLMGLGIWYSVWQYQFCYNNVAHNALYCLQHIAN